MDLLTTRNLTKIYHHTAVVDHVNLTFQTGQIIGLLGRNGAGKTTTFLMIAGIVFPNEGEIFINREAINGIPSFHRAEKGLIYLPQQHSVFLKTTAFQNLYLILELHHGEAQARKRTEDLLEEFGLQHVKHSMGFELSGGEKRRLELARSMIMKPKFLFLDEPFTGIDPITILEIQKVILKLKSQGIGIIITDHNVKDTFYITDSVYIIHKGKILSSGPPAAVVKEKLTRQVFLGQDFEWHDTPGDRAK